MTAMEKLTQLLLDYGLSEVDINHLLAKFLEEEAEEYVKAMELCDIDRLDLKRTKLIA